MKKTKEKRKKIRRKIDAQYPILWKYRFVILSVFLKQKGPKHLFFTASLYFVPIGSLRLSFMEMR
jgi:hypothetical protein